LGGTDVRNGNPGDDSVTAPALRILKNNGSGSFASNIVNLGGRQLTQHRWITYWTVGIRLADMNGNGYLDIIVGEDSWYGIDRIVFNNGNGTFNFGTGEYLFPNP
jgi:hypothetical protein